VKDFGVVRIFLAIQKN